MKNLDEMRSKISTALIGRTKELFDNHSYFAGGCVRDSISGDEINDYDVYFTAKEVAEEFNKIVMEMDSLFSNRKILRLKSVTHNSSTFKLYKENGNSYEVVQFVSKFAGDPVSVISGFDFTMCMFAYQNKNLVSLNNAESDLEHERLVYNPKCYGPLGAIQRAFKFKERGFNLSKKTLLSIIDSCKNVSDSDRCDFKNGSDIY